MFSFVSVYCNQIMSEPNCYMDQLRAELEAELAAHALTRNKLAAAQERVEKATQHWHANGLNDKLLPELMDHSDTQVGRERVRHELDNTRHFVQQLQVEISKLHDQSRPTLAGFVLSTTTWC